MKRFLIISLFCLFIGQFAYAIPLSKDFYSDDTIQTGETWMNVGIYDTPPNHTTVDMTGGSVLDSMSVNDAATFNISGGNVGGLNALESSAVNISGGSVSGLSIYGSATATISQNGIVDSVAAYSGIINMNGGTISCLAAIGGSPVVNLRGGAITDYLGADSFASVNVFGYNLAKTDSGGTFGYGQVSGFWQDGVVFVINLGGPEVYSHINLIPEPATFLLLGLGTFLLRKSNRKMQNHSI